MIRRTHLPKIFLLVLASALFFFLLSCAVSAAGGIRLTNTTNSTYFYINGSDTYTPPIPNGTTVTFQMLIQVSQPTPGKYNLSSNTTGTNFSNQVQLEVFPTTTNKGLIPESKTFGRPFFINSTPSSQDLNPIRAVIVNGTTQTYTMTIQTCDNCNGTFEIFAFLNSSRNVHHNETTHYNLTIILGAVAANPASLSPINFTPSTIYTNTSVNATTRYKDTNGLQADLDFTWRVNNTIVQILHMANVNNDTEITQQLNHTFFNKTHIVNATINVTDSAGANVSVTAIITVQNTGPSLNKTFGTQSLFYIQSLSADADCFDIDEETINWTTNDTKVNVSQQGTVTGTFVESQVGNHSINITCRDQNPSNAWFNFTLEILNSSITLVLNPSSNVSRVIILPQNITDCPVSPLNQTNETATYFLKNTNPFNYSMAVKLNQTLPGGIDAYLSITNLFGDGLNLTTTFVNFTNVTAGGNKSIWRFNCYYGTPRRGNSTVLLTQFQQI